MDSGGSEWCRKDKERPRIEPRVRDFMVFLKLIEKILLKLVDERLGHDTMTLRDVRNAVS